MSKALISILIISILFAGCASPLRVTPAELIRLHGFQGEDAAALRSIGGKAFAFTKESDLVLVLVGGDEIRHRYSRVRIADGVFHGEIAGTGAQVAVALEDIDHARIWPHGEGETGEVAVMVVTMWILLGVAVLIGWAIYHAVEASDSEIDIVIITS
ncbi:MAG: hypothetical protein O7H41_05945 [Planctomycetota bacterium]|nr:hypothetical protein [Planctomycetota bacterium]